MAKAVQFDSYGGIDVLQVRDIPSPVPGAGEVVVAIKAAGINPGEAAIREGYLESMFPTTFPCGEGTDLAGVVTVLGDDVSSLAVGDEVLGWTWSRASHATLVAVPADQLIHKPAALSWEVAGSLAVAASTAYAAIGAVDAKAGDVIAVSAAAGGVGIFIVQLLAARGVTVLAIASEANHAWLQSKGAIPIAYGDGLADRIRAAAPDGVDAFLDLFGPDYVTLAVELGVAVERINTIIAFEIAGKLGVKTTGSAEATNTAVFTEVAGLIAEGIIEVPIAASYPLDRVRDAFAELERRHTRGKIVLIP